jgi:hypothetical protein
MTSSPDSSSTGGDSDRIGEAVRRGAVRDLHGLAGALLRWAQTGQSFTPGPRQSGVRIGQGGLSRSELIAHFGLSPRPEGPAPAQRNSAGKSLVRMSTSWSATLEYVRGSASDRQQGERSASVLSEQLLAQNARSVLVEQLELTLV